MSAPFIGEVRLFPFNFAPRGWAFCAGQLLAISQNTALFSILGTTYGGNGQSTFALPDLRGRAAMHPGSGPGLSTHSLGETGGVESSALLSTELPAHSHSLSASTLGATSDTPASEAVLGRSSGGLQAYQQASPNTPLHSSAVGFAGSSVPHNNMMPYLALSYCIAMQGVFPARN